MHSLEQSVAEWRKTMNAGPDLGPETLDELETHLRETVQQLVRSGIAEPEAFHRAVSQLGTPVAMASEFQKVNTSAWLPAKVVTILGGALALALTLALLGHIRWLHKSGRDMLLGAHVLTITLGNMTALLLGLLGICYVCQRCLTDFQSRRVESISRASAAYARVAATLIGIGIVLGMAWSKIEWGQFWGWSPKEMGALCAMVWLMSFLAVHYSRRIALHGLLLMSILGSNVVGLGWLGPNLLLGTNDHGMRGFLLAAAVTNLLFFLLGLAPAGWARLRKA